LCWPEGFQVLGIRPDSMLIKPETAGQNPVADNGISPLQADHFFPLEPEEYPVALWHGVAVIRSQLGQLTLFVVAHDFSPLLPIYPPSV